MVRRQAHNPRVVVFDTGTGHIPGGALHIFWVRGRAIEMGSDFPDIGI